MTDQTVHATQSAMTAHGPTDDDVVDALIGTCRSLIGITQVSLVGLDGLDDQGETLTVSQYKSLVALARRTCDLADLAREAGGSPSTMTRMCDRLVRKGLIVRRRSPLDHREVELTASEKGLRVLAQVEHHRQAAIGTLLGHLPVGSRRQLVDSLHSFAAAARVTDDPQSARPLAR